jgi:betaine-aldehyde dehydrogenase
MANLSALNLIDGEWRPAVSGRTADSINPANQAVVGTFAASDVTDAEAAIAAARRAFEQPNWAQNPRLRQTVMLAWADRVERRTEELAQLLTRENGKVIGQSRNEIAKAASEIRYYAGLARHIPGHVLEAEPGVYSMLLKEPAGVAGIIIPWNAPASLLIRSLAPALAAGCTVVVKPAPQTVLITAEIMRELHAVPGIPRGAVNLTTETGHEIAHTLVASPDVDVISFTGSSETGKTIMAAAAATMKKLSLELGGKSCCLVFPDADVVRIAPQLAAAATVNSGQQCTAARRVLVHASRYEEMKTALQAALERIVVGPGDQAGAHMGPLIDAGALERVASRVEAAFDACDEVIVRGRRLDGPLAGGFFLSPSLVAHRDTAAFFCQEEIFGPLVVLEKFESEKEAVAMANHTGYGLAASVWTQDGARALRVARALRDGTVWINDHNKLIAEAEMGGYRRSGLGRLHGYEALLDFTETKHIYQNVGVV